MEFISGYRDPMVEYSELLFSWYQRYLIDCLGQMDRNVTNRQQSRNPELQNADHFYSEDVVRLSDLEKYVSLVDLDALPNGKVGGGAREPDDLCRIQYLLVVAEDAGTVMGIDFLMAGSGDSQRERLMTAVRAYYLLCQCMARPMDGGPARRPMCVAVSEPLERCLLRKLLPFLGVHVHKQPLRDWSTEASFVFSAKRAQNCHVCKKRSFEATLLPCDKCGAVLYCSKTCKKFDWKKCPSDISHEYWCEKMTQFMQSEDALADLPFCFSKEVTSRSFDNEKFLSARGLTRGYWTVESVHHYTSCLQQRKPAWDMDGGRERSEPLLGDTEILLKQTPKEKRKNSLVTWKEYYDWRGLNLDNPVAALLTYPLTIYHIISAMVPQHFPELNILKKQSLRIHIIEAGREYTCIMLFWELAVLMPNVVFELVFVGTDLPAEEDERSFIIHKKESEVVCSDDTLTNGKGVRGIHVKVHVRPYHNLQAAKPDLVIGFNSGFGLNDAWLSTLPRLQALRVPAYFSDCSQYSCDVDGQVVATATGGTVSPPVLNPFRSPLRIAATDNCMPWYNNAFLFYLIYKSAQCNPKKRNGQVPSEPAQAPPPETASDAQARRKKKQNGRNPPRKHK
ncbi:zinc finger MYND domain-containing protein 15 isoform X2 [Pseudophryne corroboree]|uniref:zinc finger MYND domain-containing protein 15 isoform X2 n=1 Tax=Pseudophryne corroboree TaxID=495146 RepID=UPI00308162DA